MEQNGKVQVGSRLFPPEQAKVLKHLLAPLERLGREDVINEIVDEIYLRSVDEQSPWFDFAVEMIVSRYMGEAYLLKMDGLIKQFEDTANAKTIQLQQTIEEARSSVDKINARIEEERFSYSAFMEQLGGALKRLDISLDDGGDKVADKVYAAFSPLMGEALVFLKDWTLNTKQSLRDSEERFSAVLERESQELKDILSSPVVEARTKAFSSTGKDKNQKYTLTQLMIAAGVGLLVGLLFAG